VPVEINNDAMELIDIGDKVVFFIINVLKGIGGLCISSYASKETWLESRKIR